MRLFTKKPKLGSIKSSSSFGQRKLLGILCIIMAILIGFVILPYLYGAKGNTEMIVKAKEKIEKGHIITEKQIILDETGTYGLEGYITDKSKAIGTIATTDIMAEDVITNKKIGNQKDHKLAYLTKENKRLTTISIKSNAAGLASHLSAGDIVNVYSILEDEYGSASPVMSPSLKNLEVYDIENGNTQSISNKDKKTDNNVAVSNANVISTITFITTSEEQEIALLKAEYGGNIHVVLVGK